MAKSPEAFRTISEVSALLETPAHVLRFWESKFPQVKPVKRAGGRRYYRPDDVQLLGGIKILLHEQGMTIRGVQRILREQGVRHVASLAPQSWSDGSVEGVVLGPWTDLGDGAADEEVADEAELADLEAEDGLLEPVDLLADEVEDLAEEAPDEVHAAGVNGVEAPSPLAAFLAGTMEHLAATAPPDAADPVAADPVDPGEPPAAALAEAPSRPAPPPLPPGPPTLDRAAELLRRADPARLRARADRIAPLLARLRALRADLPGPPA